MDMRRRAPARLELATACLGLVALFGGGSAFADVVTDWDAYTTAVLTGPLTTADERTAFGVHPALVAAAVYDAVNAIEGGYSVFAVTPDTHPRGASPEAAAAAASYNMLVNMFPSRAADLGTWYTASIQSIPNGPRKNRGIAVGTEVATKLLAKRASDGRKNIVTYTFSNAPGDYQATPGAPPTAPITPWLAKVKPLVMRSPSQFRGDGPPPLTSAHYAADLNETRQMGAKDSPWRTAEQTQIAKFHTMNPFAFWGTNINRLVKGKGLTLAENARLFAQIWVTMGDASIACWDGKFNFNRWRPVTAIANADLDDNLATERQSGWLPQENTPPHQEYPAGHGCASGAFAGALQEYFGSRNVTPAFTSTTTNTTRSYDTTQVLLDEIADARVFGGMHVRYSVEDGQAIGLKVADLVAHRHFHVDPPGPWGDWR
jgi:hypothetical protein